MRKSKLLAGQYCVYAVLDKVSKHYVYINYAANDADFIRKWLPTVLLKVALRDMKVVQIGIFNDVTGDFKITVKRNVSVDAYQFPHSPCSPVGENVSKEEIEKAVVDTKNQILALNSSDDEESQTKEAENE